MAFTNKQANIVVVKDDCDDDVDLVWFQKGGLKSICGRKAKRREERK